MGKKTRKFLLLVLQNKRIFQEREEMRDKNFKHVLKIALLFIVQILLAICIEISQNHKKKVMEVSNVKLSTKSIRRSTCTKVARD